MTELARALARLIAAQGPIDVASFMTLCLEHRRCGYYPTRDPLGAAGDFTTAPEISQLFGELVGAAIADAWYRLGRPTLVRLVEAGPGRGTLLADALRATRHVDGFHAALRLHLVETSPALVARQRATLRGFDPQWHTTLDELAEDAPLLFVANEFLDALPARQLVRTSAGWCERRIGLDEAGELTFVTAAGAWPRLLSAVLADSETAVLEPAPAREAFVGELARRLAAGRGLALLIDYGALELGADTLQAIQGHRQVDPLASPGEADLSTAVAFGPLGRSARLAGAGVFGPVTQATFLARLGIEARLQRLLSAATPNQARALRSGVERLVAPAAMGERFKVMALTDGTDFLPAGFAAGERWP